MCMHRGFLFILLV